MMSNLRKLQLVVLINYSVVGSSLGFVQGGIAPILRQQGITLNSMAWVFALYLPFGLAAPLLERLKTRHAYRSQIFIAQSVACVLLLAMALLSVSNVNFALLWWFALLLNIIIASLDLVLDGLSSLSCAPDERPIVAGAKVAGISLGALIGGGLLVGRFSVLGWSGVFVVVAVILLLAMPLIRLLQDPLLPPVHHKGLGLRVCWRNADFRAKLWRVALLSCCLMALFNLNRLLLVDMGLSLKTIGMRLGTLTPLGSLLLALLLPLALRRFSHRLVFLSAGALLISCIGILLLVIGAGKANFALLITILIGCICSGLLVVIGSVILDWAKSGQSATDYALLYGLGRLCATLLLIGLPAVIAVIGWQTYYAVMAGLLFLAMGWLAPRIPHKM